MSRKPRVEFAGAVYHIVSRGNRQGAIYLDDEDCGVFLDTLDEACKRTGEGVRVPALVNPDF